MSRAARREARRLADRISDYESSATRAPRGAFHKPGSGKKSYPAGKKRRRAR